MSLGRCILFLWIPWTPDLSCAEASEKSGRVAGYLKTGVRIANEEDFDKLRYTMYSVDTMTAVKQSVGCVKAATEVLGDKWTPQLLRFFINEESVRFCQLQDLAEGINPRTLSARLDRLEEWGIIEKTITTSVARCEYSLTHKGKDLMPIIVDMESWSTKYAPVHA